MTAGGAPVVVVMGVSGSGKTTLGRHLADGFGWRFHDADDFHPPANVDKMRAGIPLTDTDRLPWLARLSRLLAESSARGEACVLACSALKMRYREALAAGGRPVFFVHLSGSRDLIAARISDRKDHYMPPSLLDSQIAALEEPAPGPDVLVLDCAARPDELGEAVAVRLGLAPCSRRAGG